MKFVRSWPEKIPPQRCYVEDTLPRIVTPNYDYRCLGEMNDDILLIEWDIAVDRIELEQFIERARSTPDDVLVAPYRIYTPTARAENLPKPIWVQRRYSEDESTMRFVDDYEPTCHLFGLGLVYLPNAIIQAFLDDWPGHFNDAAFSGWHYRNVKKEVPIMWDVRPVHLHYLIDRMVTE